MLEAFRELKPRVADALSLVICEPQAGQLEGFRQALFSK